jgi:nucleoside-diphosphate-sugar epimerase
VATPFEELMIRVLLLGGSGILGSEVLSRLKTENMDYVAPSSSDLDVRDKELLMKFILDYRPNWVINCSAWTNVDGAEESFQEALELNERAVRNIAEMAKHIACSVIHISTDYVFNGDSPEPYAEDALVMPLNKYGESKLRGERALLEVIPAEAYVIRTSWLYGVKGKNFVKTIAMKAMRGEPARVVEDQVGSPTSARDLAEGISGLLSKHPLPGIYNFSNNGKCSWFELAQTIYRNVGTDPELVEAIMSSSLSLNARRPKYSLLSKRKWESSGLSLIPEWEISLRQILPEIIREIKLTENL